MNNRNLDIYTKEEVKLFNIMICYCFVVPVFVFLFIIFSYNYFTVNCPSAQLILLYVAFSLLTTAFLSR